MNNKIVEDPKHHDNHNSKKPRPHPYLLKKHGLMNEKLKLRIIQIKKETTINEPSDAYFFFIILLATDLFNKSSTSFISS